MFSFLRSPSFAEFLGGFSSPVHFCKFLIARLFSCPLVPRKVTASAPRVSERISMILKYIQIVQSGGGKTPLSWSLEHMNRLILALKKTEICLQLGIIHDLLGKLLFFQM